MRQIVMVSIVIKSGQRRSYPFKVKLPSHLPSTFYHHDGALDQRRLLDRQLLNTLEAYCKISYQIVVYCKSSDGKIYQKVEQDINILAAPLPAEPVPNYISPITKRVNYFCCINIGSIIMGARVLNTRLARRCRRGLWMPKHVKNSNRKG